MIGYDGRRGDEPAGPDAVGWNAFNRLYRAADSWFYLADHGLRSRDKLASVEGLELASQIDDANIEEWLEQRFTMRSAAEWVNDLGKASISAHRYVTLAENLLNDTAWERGLIAALDHPGLGKAVGPGLKQLGPLGSDTMLLSARRPGMDTIDILEEYGFGAELPGLLRDGVVAIGENPVVQTTALPGFWDDSTPVNGLAPSEALASLSTQLPTILRERRGLNSPMLP
jgi:crotonobetainyl-CoA:carnitine CoA-transferase CaiB-like acyl-CoA transferase